MQLQREFTIEDYVGILRRRWWQLVIPAVIGAVLAYAVSIFLPSQYTSETVVLVEGQVVPDSIVKPNGGDVNERLATMQEEILSRTRLQQIIDKFQLYRETKRHIPPEEQIVLLRKSITVSPVRPMAETRANGLPGFTVSATANQPLLAEEICTEITSFFMHQNVLLRERRAEETTDFLNKQLNDAKAKLDAQDSKLADFQRRYMGELPDETQTNFSLLSGLTSQLEATSQALSRAQQDKIFTEAMLSQQETTAKLSQSGSSPDTLQKQLGTLEEELAGLRLRYTEEHPDVLKVKAEIARVQQKMQNETSAMSPQVPSAPEKEILAADTPQAKQLHAQLFQINQTIRERTAEQARLQQEFSKVQAKLQLSPAISQEYKALTRDSQTALNVYNDLLKKHSDSEMATDLERRRQGEQFRVLDPPSLPEKPSSPNRPFYGIAGLMGGLGLGLLVAFVLEIQDTTLRNEPDVDRILKLPTLAMIPVIERLNGGDGRLTATPLQSAEWAIPRTERAVRNV
jgi:polysaccharide chain length determinant protein (PEP-CTERM system associated)